MMAKMKSLGSPITRPECDEILKDLALVLPAAAKTPDEVDRMLDLYFGLLREAGITRAMLSGAAKAFVMAPRKGKPRFFPDPGELAEMCAEESRHRRRALDQLRKGMEILSGGAENPAPVEPSFDAAARLRDLSEKMRADSASMSNIAGAKEEDRRIPSTARPATDAAELKDHINRKLGAAA
jgi:hypothetical protein